MQLLMRELWSEILNCNCFSSCAKETINPYPPTGPPLRQGAVEDECEEGAESEAETADPAIEVEEE